ncbi:nucleoside-diphosphate sugar epimerase/dehydratase [Egicoccus halophilus]|uniref:nucleoside-diphosphate sugar epimerase/dehydratase n=1 Tax=Egicoccus halophilus TaxID=1670830 RepID=UPI0013EED205|nr:nucleoside-diphosphate sugar epimerase/dehydratase [Egicoccus halophilus]
MALTILDVALVGVAYATTLVLRYELAVPAAAWNGLLRFLPIAVVAHVVTNRVAGVYGPVWQQASILEAQRIAAAGVVAMGSLLAGVYLIDRAVPLLVVLAGGLLTTALLGVLRFQSRLFAFHRRGGGGGTRVLVAGAGESAGSILRELSRMPTPNATIVGFVDDDPRKVGRLLGNVPILGSIDELVEVGRQVQAEQVLLAIPSANSTLVRRVADATARLGVPLKVLPSVSELMDNQPHLRDVRDLSIDDLLGREPISTDLASVQALVKGRCVLVTGGGGSIGSEIVRQVAAYAPARLLVLDRDETHLFDAMAAIEGRAVPILLDVRDRRAVRELFERERPDIVFHAAANKHVPLLESHPREAVTNNVLGTENLVTAARSVATPRVVFISTDKAVNPSSVMGASKRMGERLVHANAPQGAAWCAVRFGNVLGSRGSVVPTFVRQIRSGGPVTVTHQDMTRYFMSIPEAVQLVLQAAALAEDREVFMLEMGAPVRIVDLAHRMISLAGLRVGTDIEVQVTGLRPGEKITEELRTSDERAEHTSHPKILRLHPPAVDPGIVSATVQGLSVAAAERDDQETIRLLFDGELPQCLDLTSPDLIRLRE